MDYLEAAHEQREGKWATWIGLSEVDALPAVKKLKDMGFELVSTDRQLKNGTLEFQSQIGVSPSNRRTRFEVTAQGVIRKRWSSSWGDRKTSYAGAIGKGTSWFHKPVESMEQLEEMLNWFANFMEKHPHYFDAEAVKDKEALDAQRRQERRLEWEKKYQR